jgi:hypothetical protein
LHIKNKFLLTSKIEQGGYIFIPKGIIFMASSKQLYYINSLVGKALLNDKVLGKQDLWNQLGLLEDTKLEDLDNKQTSEVIKKLNELNE